MAPSSNIIPISSGSGPVSPRALHPNEGPQTSPVLSFAPASMGRDEGRNERRERRDPRDDRERQRAQDLDSAMSMCGYQSHLSSSLAVSDVVPDELWRNLD